MPYLWKQPQTHLTHLTLVLDYLLNHQSLEALNELRVSCLFSKNLIERTFCSLIDLEVFGDKLQRLKRL
ncbi:unnamed protein product [Brassica rapa subsp. trilocularis]|uniref:(rape) hypothetical protein n=1 Tax=Brassica napus TaxID=3708 RepID=A0A816VCG4_BRANA|nr:unnamed protein product [Brassica napus]